MKNLRRAFTSAKRPNTTVGDARGKAFDAARPPLPPSPAHATHPSVSSIPSSGRMTGVGLRPRAGVQPTMHSRGSILLGTNMIEDEESRRLSEMAFLT